MAKTLEQKFEKPPRLAQLILLLIPFVNWVTEVVVRWSHALRTKSLIKIIIAIIVTFGGLIVGWIDLVWCLLFKHMIFCD